jgi:hypothetical protein
MSANASVNDLLQAIGELYIARRMQQTRLESLGTELRRLQARNAELETQPDVTEEPE